MKKIISILFLSSLQAIVFVFLHDFFFREILASPIHDINWGISLQIAFIEFIIFSIVLNTFLIIYPRIKPIWPIIVAVILYSVTWMNDLFDTTILVLKLLTSACIGFLSYYLFVRLLNAITKKFVQTPHKN